MRRTDIVHSERQVFELSREYFGLNEDGEVNRWERSEAPAGSMRREHDEDAGQTGAPDTTASGTRIDRRETEKMAPEHQVTQEENAFWQLIEDEKNNLSPSARTILSESDSTAYAAIMVRSSCLQPEEYREAMEEMRLAAADLTDCEHRLLARIWRAALAAAASVDADDLESLAGYRVYAADLHDYYRMASYMIEEILKERTIEKLRKESAAREPVDLSECPF